LWLRLSLNHSYKAASTFSWADDLWHFLAGEIVDLLMPNKALQLKGEQCHGGKKSKVRLTVLATSNMDGSEKNLTFGNLKISKPTVCGISLLAKLSTSHTIPQFFPCFSKLYLRYLEECQILQQHPFFGSVIANSLLANFLIQRSIFETR
jgi:hypothetical protein